MRRIYLLLLAMLAAAVPAAAQVEGAYELTGVEGHGLPAASPDEDGVIVIGSFLVLNEDGRYTLGMLASLWQNSEVQNRRVDGGWRVEGDTLVLQPDEPSGAEAVRMPYTLQDGVLTMRDEHGHAFAYTRRR